MSRGPRGRRFKTRPSRLVTEFFEYSCAAPEPAKEPSHSYPHDLPPPSLRLRVPWECLSRASLAVMRFHTRDRFGDESDGDEEADLADRQGERPESLVVVVRGCPGIQLVADALPGRVRDEDGLCEF